MSHNEPVSANNVVAHGSRPCGAPGGGATFTFIPLFSEEAAVARPLAASAQGCGANYRWLSVVSPELEWSLTGRSSFTRQQAAAIDAAMLTGPSTVREHAAVG